LIVYGVIEIPGKILQGVLANQKLVSALFQLGVSSIGAGCSILLAAVWGICQFFQLQVFVSELIKTLDLLQIPLSIFFLTVAVKFITSIFE